MKRIFFLFLIPFVFASWQGLVGISLFISIIIFALMYMVGKSFDIKELEFDSKDEFAQLIITVSILILFSSSNILASLFYSNPQAEAINRINNIENTLSEVYSNLQSFSKQVGEQAGKSVFCSFGAVSFSISSCQGYGILAGSVSTGTQFLGVAIAELSTLSVLISLGLSFTTFFLPLGVFLRGFRISRAAGSLLISFSLVIYIFIPFIVNLVDDLVNDFGKGRYGGLSFSVANCDPYNFGGNDGNAVGTMYSTISSLDNLVYWVFLKSTLLTTVVIAVLVGGTGALNKAFGLEIDVSSLGRLI